MTASGDCFRLAQNLGEKMAAVQLTKEI